MGLLGGVACRQRCGRARSLSQTPGIDQEDVGLDSSIGLSCGLCLALETCVSGRSAGLMATPAVGLTARLVAGWTAGLTAASVSSEESQRSHPPHQQHLCNDMVVTPHNQHQHNLGLITGPIPA